MFQVFDENKWLPKSQKLKKEYQEGEPFPHILLSQFVVPDAIEALVAEFPDSDDPIWNHYNHVNCQKMATNDKEKFPKTATLYVDEMSSPEFVSWLSEMVGIPNLVPDPTLEGAGLHQISGGGFLKMHADFTYHHHDSRLRRRVNLLLYLNEGWEEGWGGELELWDVNMEYCVAKYPPLLNRAVIFSTSETSWHGHPHPLSFPPGKGRKSISLYYYTREAEPAAKMRATLFRALPSDGLINRLLMWLDQKALNLYTRAKQVCGIQNDNSVTAVLGWIGGLFSRKTKR
jgi:Rps23 Pro-64 3,4-dihydroxylase Tpa1-like proline 4-hydroxylase